MVTNIYITTQCLFCRREINPGTRKLANYPKASEAMDLGDPITTFLNKLDFEYTLNIYFYTYR